MANIVINEISQNYTYNIGRSTYAQVALPITSCWGPGYFDPEAYGKDKETLLEEAVWQKFPATQAGLEAFVSTYRGPASNYRTFKDFSYQMAMTLLTAGYDVLVCRLCPGTNAQGTFQIDENTSFTIKAKYPGTFGNSLRVTLRKVRNALLGHDYWNIITYIVDASGVRTAVENKVFVFDIENSTDSILHISEIESNFLTFSAITGSIDESTVFSYDGVSISLSGGSDISPMLTSASYEEAVAALKKLTEDLANYASEIDVYTSAVNNDKEHISKLDVEITSLQNQIDLANNQVPVDEELVAELTAKKTSAEEEKATWEKKLNGDAESGTDGDQKLLDSAKSNYDHTLNGVVSESGEVTTKGIVQYKAEIESQSVSFRKAMIDSALSYAKVRYGVTEANGELSSAPDYVAAIASLDPSVLDNAFCLKLMNQEWTYTNVCDVYDLLKDKLSYNPNRIISPGWDDQNISDITGESVSRLNQISPLHIKLMDVAYFSRCATSYLDAPKCLPRSAVYNDSNNDDEIGYAQMLSRYVPDNSQMDINGSLYSTHSALFAPWGQYKYVGTGKQNPAPPGFQALLIQRAMILNQAAQYEWLLPDNRKHNVALGKLDYTVPKKFLDVWQNADEGVGVNVITNIPEIGISLWGNSTLYEVPPATYQALANLSTRLLVNAIEDVVYKCGISITYKYNNEDAYSEFYAGVTPILDTMKNLGAIDDYYVRMSADIDGLDRVNANSVIGKIYLVVNGVINDITVDLIALPPGTDLDVYKA